MLRKILFPAALTAILLLSFALAGCDGPDKKTSVSAGLSVGVVDAETVFRKSRLAAAGMQHIEKLNASMAGRLGEIQSELGAGPEDAGLEQRLQSELVEMQTRLDREQRAVAEKINGLFDLAVEECRKEAGLEVVIPRQLVIAVGPDADITEKVIARMDLETVDFSGMGAGGSGEQSAGDVAAPETPADPEAPASGEDGSKAAQ